MTCLFLLVSSSIFPAAEYLVARWWRKFHPKVLQRVNALRPINTARLATLNFQRLVEVVDPQKWKRNAARYFRQASPNYVIHQSRLQVRKYRGYYVRNYQFYKIISHGSFSPRATMVLFHTDNYAICIFDIDREIFFFFIRIKVTRLEKELTSQLTAVSLFFLFLLLFLSPVTFLSLAKPQRRQSIIVVSHFSANAR